jgi:streptogramin lyase
LSAAPSPLSRRLPSPRYGARGGKRCQAQTSKGVWKSYPPWFTELRAHRLGRLHGGAITEFALPRRDARPFGITVDAGNNVWYTDLSGWLGRLDAGRARVR